MTERHLWEIVPVRDAAWIALTGVLLWSIAQMQSVFAPVLAAFGLAYLLNPLVRAADRRWGIDRRATSAGLVLSIVVAGSLLAVWLVPLLTDQLRTLAERTPVYAQRLAQRIDPALGDFGAQAEAWLSKLRTAPLEVLGTLFTGASQAIGIMGNLLGATGRMVMYAILVPIYLFFFLLHFDRMVRWALEQTPVSRRDDIRRVGKRMDGAIGAFFRGRLVVAAITAVLYSAGWWLTDVPYWFVIGMAAGLLMIIPYAALLAWPIALLAKYLDALAGQGAEASGVDWVSIVVAPSVPYLLIQGLETWWLTPWIQSQSLEMHFVTLLIVVFIGGAVGGFLGALLAIPAAACIKILFQELIAPRFKRWVATH